MSYQNPVNLIVAAHSSAIVFCNSHASYHQKATLSWTIGKTTTKVVFSGSGENVAMTTASGDSYCLLPATTDSLTVTATFEYSKDGVNYQLSKTGEAVSAPIGTPVPSYSTSGSFVIQGTEDATDNDYNDTQLIIVANQALTA